MKVRKTKQTGFSLIELLTALAIMAILAAILIPLVMNMRNKATDASSAGRLRQIGAALQTYIADNDMKILPAVENTSSLARRGLPQEYRYWPIELAGRGYIDWGDGLFSPRFPPGREADANQQFWPGEKWEGHIQTYGMRRWVPSGREWTGGNRDVPQRVLSVENPSKFFIVAEAVWDSGASLNGENLTGTGCYQILPTPSTSLYVDTDNTVLTLFLDGSVQSVDSAFFTDASDENIGAYTDGKGYSLFTGKDG